MTIPSRNGHPHTQSTCPVPGALRKALAPIASHVAADPPGLLRTAQLGAVGVEVKKVLCRVGCGTIWYVWPTEQGVETMKQQKVKRSRKPAES